MPENLRSPRLPEQVAARVRAFKGARQPVLMQGRLQGQWYGEAIRDKQREAEQQVANFARYLRDTPPPLNALIERQRRLPGAGWRVEERDLETASRLSTGFGLPTALETGLLLHPLYGVPYLPGSAIKGVTQAYLLLTWAEQVGVPRLDPEQSASWAQLGLRALPLARLEALLLDPRAKQVAERTEQLAERLGRWWGEQGLTEADVAKWLARFREQCGQDNNLLRGKAQFYTTIFGTPACKGRVIFFDAFPQPANLRLCVDVLTPHYQDYYRSLHEALDARSREEPTARPVTPPGDYQDPVPVPFLAVERGVTFTVQVAIRANVREQLARLVLPFIERALCERGIGAKTSSGYGQFRAVGAPRART